MFERSAKLEEEIWTSAALRTDAIVPDNDARTSLLAVKKAGNELGSVEASANA